METERLDVLLVLRRFFSSREKASDAIKAGLVYVENKLVCKPAAKVNSEAVIHIESGSLPYVSKGGLKLEKGIKAFSLDIRDKILLDVGCSTGGFADCALQHGAKFVYGIDVGSNQLHESLLHCPQLKYMENLHVKDLNSIHLDNKKMDGIVVDVSFISSTQVFPYVLPFLKEDGFLFTLIKPQFELDSTALDRNGIVRSEKSQIIAIQRVLTATKEMKLHLQNIDYAPITTHKKNIEYIALFRFADINFSKDLRKMVKEAAEVENRNKNFELVT